ncbi:PREDICTED: phospholipase A1-Ibeta2, chloroplastic [Tarenaya hassleriana]|uniref:phospholipase A1-Ibeta2, chloroplastic n=1 Tax=Tarenaya hassleriana TaxID=28532 RepID=UPI00053C414C|nr:PREDICTED: phospholipase A1-Ibeta2, chloroplastic [Tarenaya hassleriana]
MQTLTPNITDAFNVKRCRFTCKVSTLNPTKPPSVLPGKKKTNWEHLRNLEKVLRTSKNHNDVNGLLSPSRRDKKRRTLLGGLNLARIWPEMKAAVEEMSPKNLQRLQRLLSKSPEYSPKNSLGSRWRELHGSNNWVGLLDPLDENLRRELVSYGEFVQAAYHAFHSDPEGASPGHVALPDGSYKVTKSLYATSSVRLPKWIDDMAPDLRWMTQQTSCVGYVAVCDDPREIRRMGRRDIVIALRGTATLLEWAEDFRPNLVPVPHPEPQPRPEIFDQNPPKVECGFLSLYRTRGSHVPSLAEALVGEVNRLVELYRGEELSISITGHSLGAALSLLAAEDIAASVTHAPPVAVFSFGGPRVGNQEFARQMESRGVKVLRVVNNQDVVTKVPGIFPEVHGQDGNNNGRIQGALMEMVKRNNPWDYSHVGAELRVDTRMSPYLKPNADVACCHDLEAYLHLVDGFLASNCPFRANAKRSLRKLLDEQKSNVKVLYTGKAMGLNRFVLDSNNGDNALFSPSSS